ncbi:hypothetical protein [Ottowia thiooxydans]|uniref:Uncharacterized protein n=1 Tax=Ottowia thiooxydans TaxID=219182 RepID=A0ABV2Q6V7_9BURK
MKYASIAALFIGTVFFMTDLIQRMRPGAQFQEAETGIFFLLLAIAIRLLWPENPPKQQ